jgi:hypothetical protein
MKYQDLLQLLINSKEQIEYLRSKLTPTKRENTTYTTNEALFNLNNAIAKLQERMNSEKYNKKNIFNIF